MTTVPEIFGSMVFGDSVMKQRLPKDTYKALRKTIANGSHLELDIANVVANAMKDWACEHGATHYTHWFQPLTGVTAEKHDSFISPDGEGRVIMEFSGKELVRGEPDASSFPSGGLRATFEARGYTAWDPTSFAFIKDTTLYIPTAFCSYSGEALDKKTPLLRSMDAINRQALRILKLFGDSATRVITTVGPEQEYFLIDKAMFERRPDLIYCGRTLLGAKPPKGQELEDHYFGAIRPRVAEFMKELDNELWKLGVYDKTKHNEVAPAQHELAPIFSTTNIAADHNQLTMSVMKAVADRHGLACLLHEKPFAGVNGSGKHNNWSISTDAGVNLLEPGKTPSNNARFLLFLCAVIKAVDEHQDMLRLSVANAGNDHRLGANEAPPAIMSMFLGDDLTEIIEDIENGTAHTDRQKEQMEIGASVLPHFPKDTTDRNRTSPFAFTGNKFEFRSVGSTFSISGPNIVLNTIVAEALREYADKLEGAEDFNASLTALIKSEITAHKRIIFNGNNYAPEWVTEAEKRGLLNLRSTPDALPYFTREDNIAMFERHGVFKRSEIMSRYEIMLDTYAKTLHIEALTMADMVKKEITSALTGYESELASLAEAKKRLGINCGVEMDMLERADKLGTCIYNKLNVLEALTATAQDMTDSSKCAGFYCNSVKPAMAELRECVDELETILPAKYRAFPTYAEMLYSV